MVTVPFSGVTPTKTIWVSPDGSNSNDGSSAHPYETIQYALDRAEPGTTVMVKAGTYAENIEFHNSGTAGKPISLVSADGPGEAKIVPGKGKTGGTIEAFGEDHIVIDGFEVSGGDKNANGIIVTQGGHDLTNLTHHVVIKNNIVHDAVKDGIKAAQGDEIYVINNTVHHVGDQGIDFVAVNDSVIAGNDVSYVTGKAPALVVKGGSTNILIADNHVAHIANDGISVGGWTDGTKHMRPGFTDWQAKNVIVVDNHVEDVGKRPLVVLGAQESQVLHNYLESNPDYYYVVTIAPDNSDPALNSKDVLLQGNTFDRDEHWLEVKPEQGAGLEVTSNRFDGEWDGDAGPGGNTLSYDLPWQDTASATTQATLSTEAAQEPAGGDDKPAAATEAADTVDTAAVSNPVVANDAADATAPQTADAAASPSRDLEADAAAARVDREPAATQLAARDLFSDVDGGQSIPGTDSGNHAAQPATQTAGEAGADHGGSPHADPAVPDVAAATLEHQLQQG
jgi:hypothetical protein